MCSLINTTAKKSTPLLIACTVAAILACPLNAIADTTIPLDGKEIKSLIPILKKYDSVGLTQFTENGAPKKISMAVRIAAKRETVLNVFKDPDNFYYVSTLFKENTVLDEHQNAMVWSWASRHKFLSVTGKNSIAIYPPRRVDVTIEQSSIGSGKFTLQFFPDGKNHTIMLLSGLLDVNSSEWLIKFLVGNNPSMKQAMNIAIGLVVVKGVQELAERTEKKKAKRPHRTSGKSGGELSLLTNNELKVLKPLLAKGQLFLCDSHSGGRLKQVSVVDIANSSQEKFLTEAAVPDNYSKHIGAISDIEVKQRLPEKTVFSWTIGLSIFGLNSVNELSGGVDGVELNAVSGDLEGATWRWQTSALSEGRTVVAYHAFADVGKTSAILESTVKREPYLEHGLVLGSNIVMMKAMKKIVEGDKK